LDRIALTEAAYCFELANQTLNRYDGLGGDLVLKLKQTLSHLGISLQPSRIGVIAFEPGKLIAIEGGFAFEQQSDKSLMAGVLKRRHGVSIAERRSPAALDNV